MCRVPPKERPVDRGDRRGRLIAADLGRELRLARIEHGLSQAFVGRAVGISDAEISRIERAQVPAVSVRQLSRLLSVVGLELSARAYPTGAPLRDRAQLELMERFRARIHASIRWRTEVPVGTTGDLRAWDAVLSVGAAQMGLEAETRLTDAQAVERRIALKCRDSQISTAILLLADTRLNRATARTCEASLRSSFPIPGRDALRALGSGELPTGSALVLA